MNFRKVVLTAVFAGAGFAGIAHAGTLSGSAATASDDAVFNASNEVINSLTAVSGLQSGQAAPGTSIAIGSLKSVDGNTHHYAIRIENGVPQGAGSFYELTGNNNTSNKLKVTLDVDVECDWTRINGNGYSITRSEVESISYRIDTYQTQPINADVYTIKTEAYIYNA